MKRKTLRLATLLMAMMMFIALSINVVAASSEAVTKNGITAQLFVDKDAYSLGETVNAHVQVDNGTGKEVSVITKINVPDGVVLAGEDTFEGTLKDGESWSTLDDAKQTSGGMAAALPYMALAVLMSCGALAISVFGKKRNEVLSIVLCLAMLGGMVVSATPAEAADLSGSISLSCPITVAGVKSEVTAEVSYVIYGGGSDATVRVPEVKPTATPEAVPDMPEDPYNLIKNGSFEIKGAKTEYIFADWTAEAPSKTAADSTNPKFGLTTLKISNKTGRVSQMVDVEPGRTYELSGYIWMNGKVARMEVSGYSDLEGTQETDKVVILEMNTEKNKGSVNLTDENGESLTLPVSQTWNRFSYVFTAGKETEYVKVLLNTVGGFSLYDGVALRPIEAVATMDEPQPDHPGNLIVNGGFEALAESKEDDIFAGWKASDATKAHLSMDLKRYGCYSLRVSNKTALVTQMIDVEPKKTYKLSGYIYMYGTGARMFLAGYHDAEATIETLPMSTLEFNTTKIKGQLTFSNENGDGLLVPTSNTWNKFTYTFTTDPLTEYVKLSLTGLSQSSFFDDLVLQPAEAEATMVEPEPEWEGNLIKNNGFENIAVHKNDDVFANWEITDFSKAFLEPDIKRFGYHSLRVSNKTARVTQRVDVEPGRTYQLAGYVYMKGNAARVIVGSYADYEAKNATEPVKTLDINATKNSPYLTFEHKKGIGVTKPLSQTWNRFYYTFTTGKNTEYIELVLTGLSSSSYFDAITLQKIPGYVATGAVANGDFEVTGDTADDIFVGWDETKEIESIDLKVTGYDDVGSAVQVAHEGELDNCVEQMMDVIPNKGYDLTGYVYMNGESAAIDLTGYTDETAQTEAGAATVILATDGGSTEGVIFTDEDGNPVENPVAETWYQFTYKLTTDANAEYMKMVLRGIQGATTFDNVCLNKSVWIPDTGLIVNGAFETAGDTDSADDIFAGWTEVAPAGKYTSLSTIGYDDVGTAFKTNSSSYGISQKVEVEAGKTYELTGYIHMKPNASGGMKSYAFATSYTADDTALDNAISMVFQSAPSGVTLTDIDTNEAVTTMESGKWYQFSRKFTIAENVKYIDLFMRGSGGTMTVDNICLHEAEPEPETDTGLIVNGTFEKFTGKDLDAWTEAGRADRVYPADAQKYDGETSLYINGSANSISQVVSVEPNTTYEMTGYIYLNRTGIKLNAYGYQDADKATATATKMVTQINDIASTASSPGLTFTDPETGSAVNGPSTYKWYQFSYTLTTDADTKFIEVVLTGNGSAYVDNLSLFKAETEPGTTPTPTAEPTATPEVTPTPTAEPGTTPTPTAEPTATPTPSAEPTATPEVTPAPGSNLIANGTFSDGTDPSLGGWISSGSTAPEVSGSGLLLKKNKAIVYQDIDVEPGKVYELTGYVLLPTNGIGKIAYVGYKADGTTETTTKSEADNKSKFGTYLIHSVLLPTYPSDSEFTYTNPDTNEPVDASTLTASNWYQFSCKVTTDADTEVLRLYLSGHSGNSYFNNISLCEVEAATPEPTATPEVTPAPSAVPTEEPTVPPTEEPTAEPTATPEVTPAPSAVPTEEPTVPPTEVPTATPEVTPAPTEEPMATPEVTPVPTEEPTAPPTEEPTAEPTATPEVTPVPTEEPTVPPTEVPTATPEVTPVPTEAPTAEPTATPEPTPTPVINMIVNGGFENGTGGLEGWTQSASNANYAKPRGLAAYEGTYGLYLKGQGNNVSQTVDVEPGKTYELTGYVYALEAGSTGKGKIILSYSGLQEDGVTPTLTTKAMYHDPNDMNPAITYTDLETGEPAALTHGKWYQFSCVVTTDADTEYLNVVFAGYNEGYYDNISLCEVIDPNLIKNGGFETVAEKDFDAWTENFGNEALAGSTADVVHDGNYALYINNGANSISQMVEVEPGETYELTGYIYLNRKGLKLNYYGYQDADKATATATNKTMELNDVASKKSSPGLTFTDLEGNPVDGPAVLNWYKFSCKVTADADTKFLDLVLMGNGSGYYDNISLLKESATQ